MPRLTDAVAALPGTTELLVTESYRVGPHRPAGPAGRASGGRPSAAYDPRSCSRRREAALGGAPDAGRERAAEEDEESGGRKSGGRESVGEKGTRARVHAEGTAGHR